MENKDRVNGEEQLNKINHWEAWAKKDITRSADRSRKKLEAISNSEIFEESLKRQAKIKEMERKEYFKDGEEYESLQGLKNRDIVYEAKSAIKKSANRKGRREGFLSRTIRLIKGLAEVNKTLKERDNVTAEIESRLKSEVIHDAWMPICAEIESFEKILWEFIKRLGHDFWQIILFIVDVIITISFYIGSAINFISDICWDLFFWLDQNKRKLFLWFSSVVCSAAAIAILVSSVSAFEYSYYGKVLGTAKSKQDVYRTIEVLGDKLSEAYGANVNVNIERDIEFKKIYGFNIAVDDSDTILNTITYMRDLQADAYAIKIDGKTAVIMESEAVAKDLLAKYQENFVPDQEGVEITSASFQNVVTVEEVQVLLGDIWNEDEAFKYLITGSTTDLSEGEEANPLIDVYTVETAEYEEEVAFDIEYIDNTALYEDETEVFTPGVTGRNAVVAEIIRINGIEQSREILSSETISNPINAIYYQGTKPIPATLGTGIFIFPLRDEYYQSAYFGERYGIVGVAEVHTGVDFACSTGTHIYASDGGTVVFAGYNSGYGYMVQIDHGGLYQTIYAHCSELFVSTGEEVYQGKHIANVGSTGVSTGSHLHFEVRYKDIPIDPWSVLSY